MKMIITYLRSTLKNANELFEFDFSGIFNSETNKSEIKNSLFESNKITDESQIFKKITIK